MLSFPFNSESFPAIFHSTNDYFFEHVSPLPFFFYLSSFIWEKKVLVFHHSRNCLALMARSFFFTGFFFCCTAFFFSSIKFFLCRFRSVALQNFLRILIRVPMFVSQVSNYCLIFQIELVVVAFVFSDFFCPLPDNFFLRLFDPLSSLPLVTRRYAKFQYHKCMEAFFSSAGRRK